jgi:hypothetical protein
MRMPTRAERAPADAQNLAKVLDYTAPTRHGGGAEYSWMRLNNGLDTSPVASLTGSCVIVCGGETEWAALDHYLSSTRSTSSPSADDPR